MALLGIMEHLIGFLVFLGIFIPPIAGIYISLGLGELIFDYIQETSTMSGTMFSLFALIIGLLFLLGGLKKRKLNPLKKKK